MRLSYRIVNVFTQSIAPAIPVLPSSMAVTRNSGKLSGNPLCVFEDARGLDDVQMQALALQFNLSETTFLFPSDSAHARVRIFSPSYEMPFAGHPTLGTAFVVDSLQQRGRKRTSSPTLAAIHCSHVSSSPKPARSSKTQPPAAPRRILAVGI